MHNIVVADDHPLFRDAIRSVLLELFPDCHIEETENLQDTIDMAEENPDIDLILLDLNMPGMDGFNGIIQLRNNYPEIPVVVVSAEQDKSIVLQCITYGAIGFITKSSDSSKISDALKSILDGQIYLPSDIIRSTGNSQEQSSGNAERHPPIDPKLVGSLTKRQLLVFERITKGDSNKQIAYELNIAETTVKAHVSAILNKLGVNNRIQAALRSSHLDFDQLLNRK